MGDRAEAVAVSLILGGPKMIQTSRTGMIFAITLVSFSPLGIDLALPAVDMVATDLNVRAERASLLVSFFLITLGAGQVPFGRLSDRWGRKTVALCGLSIFTSGSIIAALSQNLPVLLVARVVQGAGASATTVCAFAAVRDLYEGRDAARGYAGLTATLNLLTSLAPLISLGPILLFGWRSVFWLYVVLGCVAAIVTGSGMTETLRHSRSGRQAISFRLVVSNRRAWLPGVITVVGLSFLMSHVGVAPVVLMNRLGLHESTFTLFFTANAVVIIFASLVVAPMTEGFGTAKVTLAGLLLMFFCSSVLAVIDGVGSINSPLAYVLPIAAGSVGFSWSYGTAQAFALEEFASAAGAASGVLGALQMCIAALVSGLVSASGATPFLFGAIFAVVTFFLAIIWNARLRETAW